jgi:hypothetical protein
MNPRFAPFAENPGRKPAPPFLQKRELKVGEVSPTGISDTKDKIRKVLDG